MQDAHVVRVGSVGGIASLRVLRLWTCLLVLATGCAGRLGEPGPDDASAQGHRVFGKVGFEADFEVAGGSLPRSSLVPAGAAGMPLLRVCVFRQRGRNDLAAAGHLRDDEKLACTATDEHGRYELTLPAGLCRRARGGEVRCDPKLYLATDLCAMRDGRAQVCVATNGALGERVHDAGWKVRRSDRKLMWSESLRVDLLARSSTLLQWNLSCPSESGEGREQLACERPSRGGFFDRKHGSSGYNRESVHAYWAGAMTVLRFGDLVPRKATTKNPQGRFCGGAADPAWRRRECTDAIRLVLRRMRGPGGFDPDERVCTGGRDEDHVRSRRAVCIGSPYNPWIVAHELGHALHLRWMNYKGQLNVSSRSGTVQEANKTQTSEGWADFVAAAVLHERSDQRPTFNGRDLDRYGRTACLGTRKNTSEMVAAKFFWDLWDPSHAAQPLDDISLDLQTMLEIWSLFGGADGSEARDRVKGECDPHGRNLYDFRYHAGQHPQRVSDPLPLMRAMCLDHHVQTTTCRKSGERRPGGSRRGSRRNRR